MSQPCEKHKRSPAFIYGECVGCELTDLRNQVAKLERFICHSGGLVNEWAKSCPFGTKLVDHIKGELHDYLKRNP